MKPLKDYLLPLYEKATIEQIADEYRDKGYTVRKGEKVGPYRVDLAVEKDSEITYIEVKSRREGSEAKRRIKEMIDYFNTIPNAHFQVYVSRNPDPPKIEIDDIDHVLYNYFIYNFPSQLDELSTHTRIEDVYDVSIKEIKVGKDIFVSCSGMVSVSLQYGSDSEQESEQPFVLPFPFEFKGTVKYKEEGYSVDECLSLNIDTSGY